MLPRQPFQSRLASEEYPEYCQSIQRFDGDFCDDDPVGGNWIITTNDNIAWVTETTDVPISVATINGNANPQYYVDNADPL